MKVRDFNSWQKVVFTGLCPKEDRVILRKDLNLMSKEQIESLMNTEVSIATGKPDGDYTNLYIY